MAEEPKRKRKRKAAPATRRLVIHLPIEAHRALGVASTVEGKSRRAWLSEAIMEKGGRYVVSDRGATSPPREEGAAA